MGTIWGRLRHNGHMDEVAGPLGLAARRLRLQALMSAEVVAHAAGISQARLQQIESGQVDGIRLYEAVCLAEALGMGLPELTEEAGLA